MTASDDCLCHLVREHFIGALGLLFAVPLAASLRSMLKFIYYHYFLENPYEFSSLEPVNGPR